MIRQYNSPSGSPILGTLESIKGRAEISGISATGEPEYASQTTVFWDNQETVLRNGKIVFLDQDGMEWTFDELVLDEDYENDTE